MSNTPTTHDLKDPWLVGYDAHGIQDFITASNRPLAMLGASSTITRFDAAMAGSASRSVFAGGGRGIELVDGQTAASARCQQFADEFALVTLGGTMSTAALPFDRNHESASLRWLRQRLELVKDACPPPGRGALSLFTRRADQCADCGTYEAEFPSESPNNPRERICRRCRDMTLAGRANTHRIGARIQSLLDVVKPGEYIAAVSIDGNNLGSFFEGLDTLAETHEASRELAKLFQDAHKQASQEIRGEHVPLATGGDDLRLFLSQSQVLGYLDVLIQELETGADRLARNPPFRDRLTRFGVGVGVVLADAHLPAKRLMSYAHDLERSAKRRCRPDDARTRSAIDFAVLTAGYATRVETSERDQHDGRPLAFGEEWRRYRAHAAELAMIPTSQRGLLRDPPAAESDGFAEFANQWRYQVARERTWQTWYERTGRTWRDPEKVVTERPKTVHLDLLHLLPRADDAG